MKEKLTTEDLKPFISEAQEYLTQLIYAIGRSAADDAGFCGAPISDGINQYTISFRWFRGHGNSLNIQAGVSRDGHQLSIRGSTINGWGTALGRDEFRLLTMSRSDHYSWDAQLYLASAVESYISVMMPRASWENHYGICQSSFHKFVGSDSYLLTDWAGKRLCDDCASVLTLAESVYHRTKETEAERSERDKMTPRLRWEILERDRFTCKACGRSAPDVKLHVDHKIPIAMGGKTVTENLHTLCVDCNLGKSAKMPSQATMEFWEQIAV